MSETSSRKVQAHQLTEGQSVFIRGTLSYSRLARAIEGDELAQVNRNRQFPIQTPFTTATIHQAEVLYKDANNPTLAEEFVAERRYTSRNKPEMSPTYTIESKGRKLPIIAIPSESGDGSFDQDMSGKELAPGLNVTLILTTYKTKLNRNLGLNLEQVIVNEPVKYYTGNRVSDEELQARGIVFNTPPQAISINEAQPTSDAPPAPTEQSEQSSLPLPQPSGATSAQTAHASNPAQTTPAQATTAQASDLQARLAELERENAALKNPGAPQESAFAKQDSGISPWNHERR